MRKLALPLLAAIAFPAFAAGPAITELVSVGQLEDTVASFGHESDGAVARRLSQMRLKQRLSEARLARMQAELPGQQAREQLLVLADESAALPAPPEDALPDPPPDATAKAAILARALDYLKDTMERWPSFSAVRDTTRFEGTETVIALGLQTDLQTPLGIQMLRSPGAENWECPNQPRFPSFRVDKIEHAEVPILYRGGRVVQAISAGGEFACTKGGVNTSGELKEILLLLPIVLNGGKASWSHWERAGTDKVAVFRFMASVDYVPQFDRQGQVVEIEGEIAINPRDGSIKRFSQIRRWQRRGNPREYDTETEFAPEELNGSLYLLPVRRVAMFLTPILKPKDSDRDVEKTYERFHLNASPLQEYLTDVRIGDYKAYGAPVGTPGMGLAAKGAP